MYDAKSALFLYAVSPVHMGAGTALGAIDNPVQRERHTAHPMMAGSGLKGAMRHEARVLWGDAGQGEDAPGQVIDVFGAEPEDASQAGSLVLSDAQVVLFPVRSLRQSYVYATCPTALARLRRTLLLAGIGAAGDWPIPDVRGDRFAGSGAADQLTGGGTTLVLEAFQFEMADGGGAAPIAAWLAENALPGDDASAFFREKVKNHTVVLSDDRFNYFVRNAMVVEPHVRINDVSGTADDGGLFYTENLPPETLMVSLVMASGVRRKNRGMATGAEVLKALRDGAEGAPGFGGRLLQVGGDATSGRGQVLLTFAG